MELFEDSSLQTYMKPKFLVVLVLLSLVVAGTAFFLLQNHAETETPPSAPVARTLSGAEVSALASKAQAGDAEAQTALGRIYLAGQSVKPDVKAAVKWFQSAAAQNEPEALATLGELTQAGQGVPKNIEEAARLYRLAAEKGSVAGQYNLAFLYESGQGVPTDQIQAAKWYQLAAEGGDPIAQYDIGQRYELGVGVASNRVQAYKWLSLAAAQGQPDSIKLLKKVKRDLSREELTGASQLVNAFVPRQINNFEKINK
jgi:TPR repeat protein